MPHCATQAYDKCARIHRKDCGLNFPNISKGETKAFPGRSWSRRRRDKHIAMLKKRKKKTVQIPKSQRSQRSQPSHQRSEKEGKRRSHISKRRRKHHRSAKVESAESERYRGVSSNGYNRYIAQIFIDGKKRYIGSYPTAREAALAYDAVARTQNRSVNFPKPGRKEGKARLVFEFEIDRSFF